MACQQVIEFSKGFFSVLVPSASSILIDILVSLLLFEMDSPIAMSNRLVG